ncbi:MAG TPA: dockerin type I repeat-containing protein [Planctomycetota bacterium]|nr:dockerin type I repeat-containing protein [Planctomycetota bacterium]
MGPNQDEFDSAVIDAGASATALVLGQSATDQQGLIKDFIITNFKSVFTATKWRGSIDGCVIRNNASGATGNMVMYGASGDASVVFSNCTIESLSNPTTGDLIRFDQPGTVTMTLSGCLFQTINLGTAFVRVFGFQNGGQIRLTMTDTAFDGITANGAAPDDQYGLISTYGAAFLMDRCVVRNVACNTAITCGYGITLPKMVVVRDSLFSTIDTGTHGVIGGSGSSNVAVYNCTIDSCGAAFDGSGYLNMINAYNCIVSNCTKLNSVDPAKLRLHNLNIFNTTSDGLYDTANSANVTGLDPGYEPGSFRLTQSSALIDAGDTSAVAWTDPTDLDGLPRIVDGNNDGDAAVDIGCYEYQGPPGATIATFIVTDRTSGSTLVTNEADVNVAVTVDVPEGLTVVNWQITEFDTEPTEWLAESPTSYTIQSASGADVTLYAWIKDSADNVASKPATIYYDTRLPVVSNVVITPGAPGTATVTWDTDIPAEGAVNYGPVSTTGSTPNTVPENALGTGHSVVITGVDAGTNYKIILVNNEIVSAPFYWPRPWPIDGDANMDCRVNILDLIFIRNKLNQAVTTGDNWKADVNEDTRINILDLIFVRNKLNTQCP